MRRRNERIRSFPHVNESPRTPLRIATRASRLAIWQADHVAALLRAANTALRVELVEVSTVGDRDRTGPLSQMGGVGVFTREVQAAVLDGRADIAVHSLKDLPTESVNGLSLACVPARGMRFDVLVRPQGGSSSVDPLEDLPQQARIGTGSLRRQAQLLHHRPDLVLSDIRGNVETRLQKLDAREYDAIVLAQAGLERLGFADRISRVLQPPLMLPAVGQAALGIECRVDDASTTALLQQITDPHTLAEVTAERACLHALRAGCHAPVGVMTEFLSEDQLQLQAVVLSRDGRERFEAIATDCADAAADLGRAVAEKLLMQGAERLLIDGNRD
ncbi:MAG: hydroxymethylbilane synthase [Planctomycetaceae bacterium]|nr:hydroxymethylbilane synthase [Planctomycetaceae bacterium]